ncbi:hypothetical protein Plhal304r1_c008g0030981 [Plasmopara halstedii]
MTVINLLGNDYASSSSSDSEISTRADTDSHAIAAVPIKAQLFPSADELLASDTSGVLTMSTVATETRKRKIDYVDRIFRRKTEGKIEFIMKNDLTKNGILYSSWNTTKTLVLQKRAKEAQAQT